MDQAFEVQSVFRYMPTKKRGKLAFTTTFMFNLLLPFALVFLTPVFVNHVMMEKEHRLRAMQLMMGP